MGPFLFRTGRKSRETSLSCYPTIFKKDGNTYADNFPDAPNDFTEGDNLTQAFTRASKVLGEILVIDYHDAYPKTSDRVCEKKLLDNRYIVIHRVKKFSKES